MKVRPLNNEQIHAWQRDQYEISTDKTRIDLDMVLAVLATMYWANTRPPDATRRAIEHSLCFGMYHHGEQIGFARVTTDYASIAYIGDVFVVDLFRGSGLAQWLLQCILAHPELQSVRRWLLVTQDAHRLYAKAGFTPLLAPERWMERTQTGHPITQEPRNRS